MDLNELINKNKNTVVNLGIFIVVGIFAFNIYQGQLSEMKRFKIKAGEELEKNKKLEGLGELEGRISSYKDLLKHTDASQAVNTISNIAKSAGVKLESIRPENEQRLPEYVKMPFTMMLTSPSFHNLGRFIAKIESYHDIVFIVDSLETRSEEQAKELTVGLVVSSIAFAD
jgi:Tfp pilus assembly protein PilO